MRILHLSADYPDPLAPGKTRAIANLLALRPQDEHRVYSLNRVGWRAGIAACPFADAAGGDHRAVAYGAAPKGLFLKLFLDRLADWIAEDAACAGFAPDVIHAHKLSVEGLVADRLAARLGAPVLITSQGDSDLKIIGAKKALRPVWARIWREAAAVLPLAPWTAEQLAALLGPRAGPVIPLPCPAAAPEALLAPAARGPLARSAFHLGSARRKNAATLIAAVEQAARRVPELRLEIAGGGDPAAFAALSRLAGRAAPGRVRLVGAVPHDRMAAFLNGAGVFALVSRRESYGMVFAEALFAGAPCLIPRGWGIDGWLPDGEATLAADAADVGAVAEGLERMAREEAAFKSRLAALAASGGLDRFRREAAAAAWAQGLAAAGAGA